ncbi:DUF4258 domain-containing protein [Cereibacter azotoformans]|uniref:Uncharacterized protein DUF4258 n=1 Tax=Cereibacter azotoformans TaxID=43057 RepID=A0A2T5JLK4_9RHOB|nr:DUF4258 domain-containing protein [Cereibacter azotoformans]AXQ95518.1 DUF4258 domain-containing protein [Cereibacter sphaeroides]PTR07645.1 uncharacterized protein DUF4258 [Cereibacter azotoformans]UIJ32238.1 DUF4258 domain-containing protein [Cereibacter azotoformans]
MHITHHMDVRMNQRGIRRQLVELAIECGEIDGDRYVLGRNQIDNELAELNRRRKLLMEAAQKGGVVVALEGDAAITTFWADSYSRSQARQAHVRAAVSQQTSM